MLSSKQEMLTHFPHPTVRDVQDGCFTVLAESHGAVLEVPTGEGKTAIGMTVLETEASCGRHPNYYLVPTKTLAEQTHRMHPNRTAMVLGRSEYPCLYYTEQGLDVNAQDSPCYMLACPHRVDQLTGKTAEEGTTPCPYFQAKFEARRDAAKKIVVCTTSFFLLNRLLVSGWKDEDPATIVIDEAHRLAQAARSVFEYTVTDFGLRRAARILFHHDTAQARILMRFKVKFMRMAQKRSTLRPSLMKQDELTELLQVVLELDASRIDQVVRKAIEAGQLNPTDDRYELKLLDDLIRNIPRLINSLKYSLEEDSRHALNYVVAFHYRQDDPELKGSRRRARYFLTFKAYHVVPIIRRALGGNVVALSATIGNIDVFRAETGLQEPFHKFPSSFSAEKTRIYMPTDTPSLAKKELLKRRDNPKKAMRAVIASAKQFADAGHRSLIVCISNEERLSLVQMADKAELHALSYGDQVHPRDIATRFRNGEGQALIGTSAQYSEGVDLPKQIAPIIFFLRPGYARPDDPQTQFEQRRFSDGHCWALWNWRVMIEALQVRGRNVRSVEDIGVTFFISQQFRRFVFASLPLWLQKSYEGEMTLEEGVSDAMELLRTR